MNPAGPAEIQLAALLLFGIGLLGAVLRRDAVSVLISIQLLFAAAVLALVGSGLGAGDASGRIFALLALATVAANVVVGAAIVFGMRRSRNSSDLEEFSELRW